MRQGRQQIEQNITFLGRAGKRKKATFGTPGRKDENMCYGHNEIQRSHHGMVCNIVRVNKISFESSRYRRVLI